MKIDRDDMLELTRRMSVARNCFSRIAGAYMDEDGFVDESFNTHFLKLTKSEQEKNIKIAKAIPFAKPEDELVNLDMKPQMRSKDSLWQLLMALRECELKNDALLCMNISVSVMIRAILMGFMYFTEIMMYL